MLGPKPLPKPFNPLPLAFWPDRASSGFVLVLGLPREAMALCEAVSAICEGGQNPGLALSCESDSYGRMAEGSTN